MRIYFAFSFLDGNFNETDNFLRLEGGQTTGEGDILMRNESGLIAPICGSNWDLTAANVTCKQLGFEAGAFAYTTLSTFFTRDRVYGYEYHSCIGNETNIKDCALNNDTSSCNNDRLAIGVVCKGRKDIFVIEFHYIVDF